VSETATVANSSTNSSRVLDIVSDDDDDSDAK